MRRLQAVNNVIILEKDRSPIFSREEKVDVSKMNQIPEPYTGHVESIGSDKSEYKKGDYLAFCDMGGAYIKMDDKEYVVITPNMVVAKLD